MRLIAVFKVEGADWPKGHAELEGVDAEGRIWFRRYSVERGWYWEPGPDPEVIE